MLKSIQKWPHNIFLKKYGFGWLYRDFLTCSNIFGQILYIFVSKLACDIFSLLSCLLNKKSVFFSRFCWTGFYPLFQINAYSRPVILNKTNICTVPGLPSWIGPDIKRCPIENCLLPTLKNRGSIFFPMDAIFALEMSKDNKRDWLVSGKCTNNVLSRTQVHANVTDIS